jgi:hypothetical protein
MQFFPNYRIIITKLSVELQVLVDLNSVLKDDSGLDLNVSKTVMLTKGFSSQAVFDVV